MKTPYIQNKNLRVSPIALHREKNTLEFKKKFYHFTTKRKSLCDNPTYLFLFCEIQLAVFFTKILKMICVFHSANSKIHSFWFFVFTSKMAPFRFGARSHLDEFLDSSNIFFGCKNFTSLANRLDFSSSFAQTCEIFSWLGFITYSI
jgi:hypothetical protein